MSEPRLLFALLGIAAVANGQDLRRGLVDANAVFVGRQVGRKAHDDQVALHRVQVVAAIRGVDGAPAVTVIDWPNLSVHNRPMPRQTRLYCLQDASAVANRLGLPPEGGPYFKMVGWPGSHPLVGADLDSDPLVRFARLLAASEAGAAPAATAAALCSMAMEADPVLRTEAARHLVERGDLRARLSGIQWNMLVTRTTAEIDDLDYKIALAELCAEQRLDGLLDALMISLGPVSEPEYARCVGRIGRLLHGEQATSRLVERLRTAGQPNDRRMLLLAIGATNTASAYDALMQMDRTEPAVEAALREHRFPQARDAVQKRRER